MLKTLTSQEKVLLGPTSCTFFWCLRKLTSCEYDLPQSSQVFLTLRCTTSRCCFAFWEFRNTLPPENGKRKASKFWGATKLLYNWLCPSVGRSVCWLGNAFTPARTRASVGTSQLTHITRDLFVLMNAVLVSLQSGEGIEEFIADETDVVVPVSTRWSVVIVAVVTWRVVARLHVAP